MSEQLFGLSDADLRGVVTALRSGRLTVPGNAVALQRLVSTQAAGQLSAEFQRLADQGFSSAQLVVLLETLLKDRARRFLPEDAISLVTTGPEAGTTANRDTGVVVRELFATAEQSVLVAGYAVYRGQRVFRALADRMQDRPELSVRLFLDVRRNAGDTSLPQEVVRRFGERFVRYDWPAGCPVPEIYYFPLSLEESAVTKAVLHAKCVVVDGQQVFVSSANFTEAAQNRNIEVGLLIRSEPLARRICNHFEAMVADGVLQPVLPRGTVRQSSSSRRLGEMTILFLHGWQSAPGGVKPTFLARHGHAVLNPALPDEDFEAAVRIAQAEFDRHQPDVVVGSSRGGAVAMNIQSGDTPLVLLCPAWKRWGTATAVKPNTVILHSRADDTVLFADSEELVRNSGLPESALIEVGTDHRLADPEPLGAMLQACERLTNRADK